MLPHDRRLGAHLPLARGMRKTVDRAIAIGAEALQIFSDNPTAWRRRAEPSPELAEFRLRLAERDIRPVAIHASYLVNLPGPDEATFGRSVAMLAGSWPVLRRTGHRWSTSTSGRTGAAVSTSGSVDSSTGSRRC